MIREKVWNFWASKYEKLWVQKYSLGPTRRELLNFMRNKLKTGNSYKILDVGCGTGQLLRDIKREFSSCKLELTGIDFSREMIRHAREQDSSIDYRVMNVGDLKTLEKGFDMIICTHSFPYYDNQKAVLEDMREIIKTGGYLLLAQASQNSFYDALAMFFVKFTTGKAKYPSVAAVKAMSADIFQCEDIIRIKEKPYMPSIYFFVLRGVG